MEQDASQFDFSLWPASTSWLVGNCFPNETRPFWYWVKSPAFPIGIIVLFPPENPQGIDPRLTMRRLLGQLHVPVECCFSWTLNGMIFESAAGTNPLLDQPLPPVLPGADPQIYITCEFPHVHQQAPIEQPSHIVMPQVLGRAVPIGMDREATPAEMELLVGIHGEWGSSLHLEADLLRQRKKITDLNGKLKTLNRDLNTDERTYSSSQDKKDWQDARRWLRDCQQKLARCLKDYDIGFTSAAGQRTWFEEAYENFVVPRKPFEGLEQAFRDFQIYHKSLQSLNNSMKGAIQFSMQNGEKRAQRVLNTIQAKVREGNAKKSFLGVITNS